MGSLNQEGSCYPVPFHLGTEQPLRKPFLDTRKPRRLVRPAADVSWIYGRSAGVRELGLRADAPKIAAQVMAELVPLDALVSCIFQTLLGDEITGHWPTSEYKSRIYFQIGRK